MIDCQIDKDEMVFPMSPAGKPIEDAFDQMIFSFNGGTDLLSFEADLKNIKYEGEKCLPSLNPIASVGTENFTENYKKIDTK